MAENIYLSLAAVLLLPLLPAFILYKYLPASDTDVSGPYSGLSLKLKGAFAGYFLLVLVGAATLFTAQKTGRQNELEQLTQQVAQKEAMIKSLNQQLDASKNPVIDWHIKGAVLPSGREGTRFFYDDGTTENNPDGSFQLTKRSIAKEGAAKPPKWICVYNLQTGFRVVSLNRDLPHPDIAAYQVEFNDSLHEIRIRRPIDINSLVRDSVLAVANFAERYPEVKTAIGQTNPDLLQKARNFRVQQTATPR